MVDPSEQESNSRTDYNTTHHMVCLVYGGASGTTRTDRPVTKRITISSVDAVLRNSRRDQIKHWLISSSAEQTNPGHSQDNKRQQMFSSYGHAKLPTNANTNKQINTPLHGYWATFEKEKKLWWMDQRGVLWNKDFHSWRERNSQYLRLRATCRL